MNKFSALLFPVVLFACLANDKAFAQNIPKPVDVHGALRVEAGKVVNQAGVPPQLRGISFSWSVWGGKKYYNKKVAQWIINDFNGNLIRVAMAVEPKGGYLDKPEEQLALITEVVDEAIALGVYVIIDWHDHHAAKNRAAAKVFFAKMAKKYSTVPNVIYEIWNEPEQVSWPLVKSYAVELIAEIRKWDADNLILVGSPHWDQDVDIVANDPIKDFENIAYTFHFYASDPFHQEKLREKAEMAMEKGIALLVSEWGVGESNGDGVFDRELTQKWVNWMEKHQLSRVNWNVTDKDETTALLQPGASAQGGWEIEELSESGKYIRSNLRKYNPK